MDNVPSEDLLHSVHPFPGTYQIKAIGTAEDNFVGRVVEAVVSELATPRRARAHGPHHAGWPARLADDGYDSPERRAGPE